MPEGSNRTNTISRAHSTNSSNNISNINNNFRHSVPLPPRLSPTPMLDNLSHITLDLHPPHRTMHTSHISQPTPLLLLLLLLFLFLPLLRLLFPLLPPGTLSPLVVSGTKRIMIIGEEQLTARKQQQQDLDVIQ